MSIKSFDDFFSPKPVAAPTKEAVKVVRKPVQETKKSAEKPAPVVNEAAMLVEDAYRVKTVVDVPKAVVDAYCRKVESETGKSALFMFSHEELAEEMVKYLVKKMSADTIPASLSVGEEAAKEEETAPAAETETDPFEDETEEVDIEDGEETTPPAVTPSQESDEVEMPMKKGTNALDFEGDEVDLGEKDSIELDPAQPK